MSHSTAGWARPDLWGPVMALLAVGLFVIHGYDGALTRDAAVYAYAGQQVAEGVPPYVQILNRVGPLAHLVPGAGAAVGGAVGVDDLLAMRLTMTMLSALAVWAAYVLGRDLYRSRATGVVTAAVLLSFQGFVTYATSGPREKTFMVLLFLVVLSAAQRRRWALAGVATALATLTWQGSFPPLAVVVLVSIAALPGRAAAVAVLRFAGSGLAVAAAAVVYFVAVGAFPELYEGFYAVNAGYTRLHGLLTMLERSPGRLVLGYGWSLVLLVLGIVGSLVLAALRLRGFRRAAPEQVAVVALGAGAVTCLAWALRSFEGWPDAFPFLPFAACGVAGTLHALLSRLGPRGRARVVVALVLPLVVATAVTAVLDRSTRLDEQRHAVVVVLDHVDDPVLLAVNNPTPLVLGHLRNPIRYQVYGGGQGHYLEDTYPGALDGLGRDIGSIDPTFVTVKGVPPDWLRPTLHQGYARVGGNRATYAWFVSTRATTPDQRSRMRRALAEALGTEVRRPVRRSLP